MRLKEIRKSKGLTQKQIADYLGFNPSVYSRYEAGEREPSIPTLIQLSGFIKIERNMTENLFLTVIGSIGC